MRRERSPGILPSVSETRRTSGHPPPSVDGTQCSSPSLTAITAVVAGDGSLVGTALPAVGGGPSRSPSCRNPQLPGPHPLGALATRHTPPQQQTVSNGDVATGVGRFLHNGASGGGSSSGAAADGLPAHSIATLHEVAGCAAAVAVAATNVASLITASPTAPNPSGVATLVPQPRVAVATVGPPAVATDAPGASPGAVEDLPPRPPPIVTPLGITPPAVVSGGRGRRSFANMVMVGPNGRPTGARRSSSPSSTEQPRAARRPGTNLSVRTLNSNTNIMPTYYYSNTPLLETPGSPSSGMQPRPPLQVAPLPLTDDSSLHPPLHANGVPSPRVMRLQLVPGASPHSLGHPQRTPSSSGRQVNIDLDDAVERSSGLERRLDEQLSSAGPMGVAPTGGDVLPPAGGSGGGGGGGGDARHMAILADLAAAVGELQRRVAEMSPRLPYGVSDAGSGCSWCTSTRSSAPGFVNGDSQGLGCCALGAAGPWAPPARGTVSYSGAVATAVVAERTTDERLALLEQQMKKLTAAVCDVTASATVAAATAPPRPPPLGSMITPAVGASGDGALERSPPSPLWSELGVAAETCTTYNPSATAAASAASTSAMGIALGLVAAAAMQRSGRDGCAPVSQRPKAARLPLTIGLLGHGAAPTPTDKEDHKTSAAVAAAAVAAATALERLGAVERQVQAFKTRLEGLENSTTINITTVAESDSGAATAATAAEGAAASEQQQQQQKQLQAAAEEAVAGVLRTWTQGQAQLESRVRECEAYVRQLEQQQEQQLLLLQQQHRQHQLQLGLEEAQQDATTAAAQKKTSGADGVSVVAAAAEAPIIEREEEEHVRSPVDQMGVTEAAAALVFARWQDADAPVAPPLSQLERSLGGDRAPLPSSPKQMPAVVAAATLVLATDADEVAVPQCVAGQPAVEAPVTAEWQQRLLELSRQMQDMTLEVTSARAQASSCTTEIQAVLEQVQAAQATAAAAAATARHASTAASAAERAASAALDVVDVAATRSRVAGSADGGGLLRRSRSKSCGGGGGGGAAAASRLGLQSPKRSEVWLGGSPRFADRMQKLHAGPAAAAAASAAAPAGSADTDAWQRPPPLQHYHHHHQYQVPEAEDEEEKGQGEDIAGDEEQEQEQDERESLPTVAPPSLMLPSRRLGARDVGFRIQPDGEDVVIGVGNGGSAATLYGVSASRASVLEATQARLMEVEESLQEYRSRFNKALAMRVTRDELRESVAQLDSRISVAAAGGMGGGGGGGGGSFVFSRAASRVMSIGMRGYMSARARLGSNGGGPEDGWGEGGLGKGGGGGDRDDGAVAATGRHAATQGPPVGLVAPGHRITAWTQHGVHITAAAGAGDGNGDGGDGGGISDSVRSHCGGGGSGAGTWNPELCAVLTQLQRSVGIVEQRLEAVETGVVQSGAAQAALAASLQQLQSQQPPQDRAATAPPQPYSRNGSVARRYGNGNGNGSSGALPATVEEQLSQLANRTEVSDAAPTGPRSAVQADLGRQVLGLVERTATAGPTAGPRRQGPAPRGRELVQNGTLDDTDGRLE